MMNRLLKYFKDLFFVYREKKKINRKGSLLYSFYNKKIIFIHIPKTAGTSMIKSIFGDVSMEGHRNIKFYQRLFGAHYKNFFIFCFVRNPWDRLYSSYRFLEKGGVNIHDKNAYDTYLSGYNDFEDFVLNGLTDDLLKNVIHFIPQSNFVCNDKNDVIVDFVGKFEHLDSDVKKLSVLIKKDINLGHYNQNINKCNYTDVYTSTMISKVNEVYQLDIDTFRYKFRS